MVKAQNIFQLVRLKPLSIIALTACLAYSCEKVVYFDVEAQGNRLVVNAFISPDQVSTADISLSVDPLAIGFDAEEIDDATVTLYKNDVAVGNYYFSGNGTYTMDAAIHDATPGDRLKMEVSAPGYPTVTASTSIPGSVDISSVTITDTTYKAIFYSVMDSLGNITYIDTIVPYYKIALTFTDPPGENHYALLVAYEDAFSYSNACITTQDPIFGLENDWVADNLGEDGEATICEEIRFPDQTFEGNTKTIYMEVYAIETTFTTDPKFTFTLSNHSEEYHQYIKTASLQAGTSGNPFSEPVVVYSNIDQGFGIFAGYSRSIFTLPL